jgi:radical SAM protein with 4Fe4S-binding SPASM domain
MVKIMSALEINLLKYFTLKRFINSLKMILSFNISKILHKSIVWGMPISYSIEPTNFCNLSCPECPSGLGTLTRPLGLLNLKYFMDWIDQIKGTGFYIQLFFQGEPFINKQLPEMINYAQKNNVYVSVSTNGHFINEKNLDFVLDNAPNKLIFSVDGLDEEIYQKYRVGGTFKQADSGLRMLIERKKQLKKKNPFIEFQFIVMKQNEHQLNEVKKYCEEVGVDKLVFKTMQISSKENATEFLPSNPKYQRYKLTDNSFIVKNKIKNQCFALWRTSVITWDGKVVPCCFDKNAEHSFGTLNGKKFSDIWKSDKYQQFRNNILRDRKQTDICTNCTEGLKINILEIEQ